MKKIVRLTESDLIRLVKRVINEDMSRTHDPSKKFVLFPSKFSKSKATLDGVLITSHEHIVPNQKFKLILQPKAVVNYVQGGKGKEIRCTSTSDCWITEKSIGDHLFDQSASNVIDYMFTQPFSNAWLKNP